MSLQVNNTNEQMIINPTRVNAFDGEICAERKAKQARKPPNAIVGDLRNNRLLHSNLITFSAIINMTPSPRKLNASVDPSVWALSCKI
jgi:hypothetical protein